MGKMIRVEQVMTEKVTVANLNNKFSQVMDFFDIFKIHHLPVTDDDQILGILSLHDVLHYLYKQLNKGEVLTLENLNEQFTVESVMTPNPVTVTPDASLLQALELFDEGRFRALPVTENGKIRGIITYKDLMRVYSWEKHELYDE